MNTAHHRNRRWPLACSIGTRLTLWGTGVALATGTVVCAVLYTGLYYSLRAEVDTFLEGEVNEFMITVNSHPGDDQALEADIRLELGSRAYHDLAFRLFDREGHLIVTSEPQDVVAPHWRPTAACLENADRFCFETLQPPGSPDTYRLCSRLVTTADGRHCVAQASYRMERVLASLGTFRRFCIAALVLSVLPALLGGRVLARRSLGPVQTLVETARRIDAGRLSERIPLTGTGDELDRLAETLNSMLDRIEQHIRRMQQFTADASHELRTPLAALRGNAEVALTRPRSAEELRQVIEDSIEHYDRLARTAEALLLLARADAGRDIIRREPVRLDRVVADVLDLYEPVAQDRRVDLRSEIDAAPTIIGDGALLRQLLSNLVDNALKYTDPPGTVLVSLRVGNDGRHACLTVNDDGVGIPPPHLEHVFDRFYRVDRSRSPLRGGGSGLGLAICKTIAEAHGGRIAIASRPGCGTTISVELPISDSGIHEQELTSSSQSPYSGHRR